MPFKKIPEPEKAEGEVQSSTAAGNRKKKTQNKNQKPKNKNQTKKPTKPKSSPTTGKRKPKSKMLPKPKEIWS